MYHFRRSPVSGSNASSNDWEMTPEANQAFSKDGTSSIMRVGVEIPHLTGINGGQLGIQHDLDRFLLLSR